MQPEMKVAMISTALSLSPFANMNAAAPNQPAATRIAGKKSENLDWDSSLMMKLF